MDLARAIAGLKSCGISRTRVVAALIFTVPLAIYLAFANQNYGHDATTFILDMEEGTAGSLFHPHHLMYNPLGYAVTRAIDGIGITASTAWTMQIVNSIAGAAGVLVFFMILLKLSNRIGLSALFALLMAFSMAYWEYAIEVEVYVIPVVFLLTGLLLMLDHLSGDSRPGAGLFLKLGLLTSFASLFHQMHIMFFVVVFVFAMLTVKDSRQRVKLLGVYLAPFAVLVGGAYVAAAQITGNLDSLSSFWGWLTTTFHVGAGWGTLDYKNIPSATYGLFKTFFARSEARDFLLTGVIDGRGIALVAVLAAACSLLAALAATTAANLRRVYRSHRGLTLILLVWIAVYGAFCVWFDPYTHEFWIPLLPPAWLLVFLAIQQWNPTEQRSRRRLLLGSVVPVVLLVLLASVNLAGDILPNSDIGNNENYNLAREVDALGVDENDLVLIWGPVPLENYCELFFDRDVRMASLANRPEAPEGDDPKHITKEEWLAAHERVIEDTFSQGGRVFISENEITPNSRESGAFLGETRFIRMADYTAFYARYEDRLEPVFSYEWRSEETRMFEIKGSL